MVNIDQSTVNTAGSQTGFGLGRSGPGQGEHVAICDAATSCPWALTGPRVQAVGVSTAHGGPMFMVHGSQTSLRWTESTLHLLGAVHVHRVHTRVTDEGEVRCFSCGGAPTSSELAVSPYGGAGVRLGRGKTYLGHGDCVGGVKVAARASQGASHGERRLELHRRAGMVRGYGISQFYGARGRHNAPAAMLGRSRGPLGPLVALAMTAPF
jgi:hypothetical protein